MLPRSQQNWCGSHYLEARSLNEREYRDRRYVDEYRNDYCEGYVPRHYHRDIESSYRIHCNEIVDTLGEGAFGKVVECIDHAMDGMHVAVKIVKNVGRYREAARSEIQVLEHLNSTDPNSVFRCVQMLEWFDHHGHVCIVFELLGLSTYDFIKENSFLPFQIDHIRQMAYQICQSINFLHHNKLTHTDLKPENILFVKSDYVVKYNSKMKRDERTLKNTDIKVVDFGSATYDDEHHSTLVSTRHYRAPELGAHGHALVTSRGSSPHAHPLRFMLADEEKRDFLTQLQTGQQGVPRCPPMASVNSKPEFTSSFELGIGS
ncbi:Dual specificity protein kinase CLK4 [Tupaia chinensis]|uniref:dual-specificity kinase n=1 Tax=Tupaia chinensis TaxID=246437 RepID=L9JBK2_TUPCH|nr:Dual specificity protein kinase CLK4 [Tupaia chinensis]